MKKHFLFGLSTAMILMLSGCTTKDYNLFQESELTIEEPTKIDQVTYEQEVSFENIIAPNDRVDVTIYIQSGEGSQQMTSMLTARNTTDNTTIQENAGLLVTRTGTVRLPLLGSVNISGLTQDEASEFLINEYKKFIRNPYVTVEIKNQRIIVLGEVSNPGIVPVINGTMNVLEALARTGDFTFNANRNNIKVIRGDLRNPETRIIDLTKLDAIKASSLYLKPNDIVYVQSREMTGYNRVFNEVNPFFNMLSAILSPLSNSPSLNILNTKE